MNPGIGCATRPLLEMLVLSVEAGERPPLEGVLLHVIDSPLDLALVPWRSRLRGEHGRAIVPAEVFELPKSTWASNPVGLSIRRNDTGGAAPCFLSSRRTLS